MALELRNRSACGARLTNRYPQREQLSDGLLLLTDATMGRTAAQATWIVRPLRCIYGRVTALIERH